MDEDDFTGQNDPEPGFDVNDKLAELKGLSEEDILKRARKAQLMDLLAKLELGMLSHQEHAVLRNLIRDNGLTLTPYPPPDDANGQVTEPGKPTTPPVSLPELDTPEYEP